MKRNTIKHKFVDLIPDVIEEGVLYISIPYATTIHKCACKCGETVVIPIKPTDWTLIWNGETISITPSIGSWSLPCKSHYWIKKNKIVWSRRWSKREIKSGRVKDKKMKNRRYSKLRKWFGRF